MSLLKRAAYDEVKINVEAKVGKTSNRPAHKFRFVGVYKDVTNDMDHIRAIGARLRDEDDQYGDQELVDEFFIRWEGLTDFDGTEIPYNEDNRDEVLQWKDIFHGVLSGCTQALFGDRGRLKN